jgi:hypothetical protein
VLVEFQIMKCLYPKWFKAKASNSFPMFSEERLGCFRELSLQFTLKYHCPLCKSTITQCPVQCRNLIELGNAVVNLILPFVAAAEEYVEDAIDMGDTYPDLSTYFVYFKPNFIDISLV